MIRIVEEVGPVQVVDPKLIIADHSSIKLYISSSDVDFDAAVYSLRAGLTNLRISHSIISLSDKDAFGFPLPLLRIENQLFQRGSFFEVLRVLYASSTSNPVLKAQPAQASTIRSRISHVIDECATLDEISTFLAYFSDEPTRREGKRDAYNWLLSPVKKIAYRWRMRVLSNYFDTVCGYSSNQVRVASEIERILSGFAQLFQEKVTTLSVGSLHDNLSLDITNILVSAAFFQLESIVADSSIFYKITAQEKLKNLKSFTSEFIANNPVRESLESNNEQVPLVQIGLVFEEKLAQQQQQANSLSDKKQFKLLVNNFTLNSLSLLFLGMILFKFTPRSIQPSS